MTRISLRRLRKILDTELRTDADFTAFVLDYFEDAHREMTRGMTRSEKFILLVERAGRESVQSALLEELEPPSEQEASVEPISVLFVASLPTDQGRLQLDEEFRRIKDAIDRSQHRDEIELQSCWATQRQQLQDELLRVNPHVLHFAAHGDAAKDAILLRDVSGQTAPVNPHVLHFAAHDDAAKDAILLRDASWQTASVESDALADLMRITGRRLRAVMLNACFSLSQAQAIVQHIDAAIGMNRPIGDEAAIELATGFYRGLAYGLSLQDAFELGLNALKLGQISETHTPQLLTREGVDASSIYLLGSTAA